MGLHLPGARRTASTLPRVALGIGATLAATAVGAAALWRARRSGDDELSHQELRTGPRGRSDSAASLQAIQSAEEVTAELDPEVPDHAELPLPDFDHMSTGSLRSRIRGLELPDLVTLRAYEKAHADRLPVVTLMDQRIASLAARDASPTGNVSDAPDLAATPTRRRSKVKPVTSGPAMNPPSQGVPTNPAQPRSSGSGGLNPDAY